MKRRAVSPSVIRKMVASLATVAMLGAALILSVVVFGCVAIAAVIAWGCLCWKTQSLSEQMNSRSPGGLVIEGEVINKSVAGV